MDNPKNLPILKHKIMLVFIVFISIPILTLGIYFYYVFFSNIKDQTEAFLSQSVNIIVNDLNTKFHLINNTSLSILADTEFRNLLQKGSTDTNPKLDTYHKNKIEQKMQNMVLFNHLWEERILDHIFIIDKQQNDYSIFRDSKKQNSYLKFLHTSAYKNDNVKYKHLLPPTAAYEPFYFIRKIYDTEVASRLIGTLFFAIEPQYLLGFTSPAFSYEGMEVFIFDEKGNLYSNPNLEFKQPEILLSQVNGNKGMFTHMSNDIDYFMSVSSIEGWPLYVGVAVPKHEVFYGLNSAVMKYLFLILIILIASALLGILISSSLLNPFVHITHAANEIKKGNYDVQLADFKYMELNDVSTAFNTMTKQIEFLINQVYKKQLLVKETELSMLTAQINPHFLLNVLDTIGWEALLQGQNKIHHMITSIGELLRSTILFSNREKITLREELGYIEYYLSLQKIRFEDKLNATIEIKDKTLYDVLIPKLCLQTFVENAVTHGIEPKDGPGNIIITIDQDSNMLTCTIADDGIGFDDTNLYGKADHTHIGIKNVDKRIELLYGSIYGVTIHSVVNNGTTVFINLPIDKEE